MLMYCTYMCVLLVLLVVLYSAACVAGPEAASRVPAEFVVQHAEFANPPALLLTLERVLRKLAQPGQQLRALLDRAALENLFERVRAWTDWCVPSLFTHSRLPFSFSALFMFSVHLH